MGIGDLLRVAQNHPAERGLPVTTPCFPSLPPAYVGRPPITRGSLFRPPQLTSALPTATVSGRPGSPLEAASHGPSRTPEALSSPGANVDIFGHRQHSHESPIVAARQIPLGPLTVGVVRSHCGGDYSRATGLVARSPSPRVLDRVPHASQPQGKDRRRPGNGCFSRKRMSQMEATSGVRCSVKVHSGASPFGREVRRTKGGKEWARAPVEL